MSTTPSLLGQQLGSYTVQTLLGSGGMATVYHGFDHTLQRPVAIKVLSVALAADPEYVDRFLQEARLLANVRHPHIAQIYTFGEHAGAPYMVQEFLPGPTLDQYLRDLATRNERMPHAEVLECLTHLASALDAAHAVGIIHRDVKPSNAIRNASSQWVLTDFGIARNTMQQSTTMTAPGIVMGTPGYIAPEQALSSMALTPACDIYALGIVLFELLIGRLPFEADSPTGVVLKHLYDDPPIPSSLRPELPPALDVVVVQALQKDPAARFASAGALAQAAAQAWPLHGSGATAPGSPDIHRQVTQVWASRPAVQRPVSPPVAHVSSPPSAPQGTAPLSVSLHRSRLLLPLLGLLFVLLLGGIALATRASTSQTAGTSTPLPLAPSLAPTAETANQTSSPTEAPPQTMIPAATAIPPVTTDPIADLQTLLTTGIADGRAGKDGKDLTKRLDEMQEALQKGDAQKAAEQIRELQNKLREQQRKGKIDNTFAEQALAGTEEIISAYNLPIKNDE